jgi:hypothetical protein
MSGETDGDRKYAGIRRGSRARAAPRELAGQVRAWPAGVRRVHAGLGRGGRASTAGMRRAGLLGAVTVAAVALVPTAGTAGNGPPQAPHASAAPADGPFVTLLFSRTEISAADDCVQNDTNIARLDTMVAPFLHSLGLAGTGTLVTDRTGATARHCTHYNDDLTASWADATSLAQNDGWSFVSHTATYPTIQKIESLTPAQAYHQTCGTIATLTSHGLPGATGMIAYPGAYDKSAAIRNLQENYGSTCFDWGRIYRKTGLTTPTDARTPPYWQHTTAVEGGACNNPALRCYNIWVHNTRYTLPSQVIAKIQALKPGQWFTLQAYLLVTGTNPKYTQDRIRWDCTSPDPADHWANHVVRYCWSDYQKIIQAVAAMPSITVTDPLTVGKAWGRPFT